MPLISQQPETCELPYFELYDSRFVGPCSEDSVVDLLLPVTG